VKLRTPKAQSQRPIRPQAPLPPDQAFGASTLREAPRAPRRGRVRQLLIALATLTALALLGAGGWQAFATVAGVQAPQITRAAAPTVRIDVDHALLGVHATNVHVSVDGREDAAAHVRTSGARSVSVTTHELGEGSHNIRVTISKVGVFRRTLHASTTVVVDTIAPRAKLTQPSTAAAATPYLPAHVAAVTTRPAQLKIAAEAGASIELTSTARALDAQRITADELGAGGVWKVALPEGGQQLTLRVRDGAGNTTTVHRRVLVDTAGPVLRGALAPVVKDNTLDLHVSARDVHGVELQLRMDGAPVEDALERTVVTAAPNPAPAAAEAGDAADADDATDTPAPIAASYHLLLPEPAFEGRHTLQLIATDSVGSVTRLTKQIVIDSTDSLQGAAGLRPGARGGDVVELQRALIAHDDSLRTRLSKELTARLYGGQTTAAVKSYQSAKGIDADGVAGSDTLAALTLKIIVDRATHKLTLFRAGSVVKVWNVAVGQPKYPTVPGSFEIVNMQKNPTWTPPDSVWAKDAKPIGPGADNPLGTRWMGIGGSVGIHGTSDPSSIGYSVSHGCIRMQIPDVEELFDMVRVGTPVTIV
jgi:lipoprotein-anchoring transpeptidase ErfK/SrfK